jgi:hypothetical protein
MKLPSQSNDIELEALLELFERREVNKLHFVSFRSIHIVVASF